MLVNKGDKLIVTKDIASFLKTGDIVEVVDVGGDIIAFAFGEGFMHKGVMNNAECEAHFTKYVEPEVAPTVTEDYIEWLIENSELDIQTVFDKCTVVSCKLPNGFIITESSACVSPENYNVDLGIEICMDKITNKVWELEGYVLQNKLYEENGCPYGCDDCDECPCEEDCEVDECLDTDLDCDDCEYRKECWWN